MTWQSPDSHHLRAAQGGLELVNWREANAGLAHLTPEPRAHPDALMLRVEIYSAAKKWEECAIVADGLAQIVPDEAFPYLRGAFALHELKRTKEALNTLLPIADKFPDEWVMRSPATDAELPWKLLGVHSARMDVGSRDAELDETLGLNCAWYADILLTLTK